MALSPREVKELLEAHPPRVYEDRDEWGYLVWYVDTWSPFEMAYGVVARMHDEEPARVRYREELVKHEEAIAAYAAKG